MNELEDISAGPRQPNEKEQKKIYNLALKYIADGLRDVFDEMEDNFEDAMEEELPEGIECGKCMRQAIRDVTPKLKAVLMAARKK